MNEAIKKPVQIKGLTDVVGIASRTMAFPRHQKGRHGLGVGAKLLWRTRRRHRNQSPYAGTRIGPRLAPGQRRQHSSRVDEFVLPPIVDMKTDIDFCRSGPQGDNLAQSEAVVSSAKPLLCAPARARPRWCNREVR